MFSPDGTLISASAVAHCGVIIMIIIIIIIIIMDGSCIGTSFRQENSMRYHT